MIDEGFYILFSWYIRVSSLFGGLPYWWNTKKRQLYCTRRSVLKFRISCFLLLIYNTWAACAFYLATSHASSLSGAAIGLTGCMLLGLSGDLLLAFAITVWMPRYAMFFTSLFQFMEGYQGKSIIAIYC
jgi:uncharacterized Tic20 family protein